MCDNLPLTHTLILVPSHKPVLAVAVALAQALVALAQALTYCSPNPGVTWVLREALQHICNSAHHGVEVGLAARVGLGSELRQS